MSTPAAQAFLGELKGTNIMAADLDAWRERLQSTPWIREATFKRSLPSTIDVAVVERDPIGIGRLGGKLYLIDERGAVIDEYGPDYADFDLPIIDGLQSSAADSTAADGARADLAARLIASLKAKPVIVERLSQVDVSDVHNASVIVTGDPARIFVGDDRFLVRLESYLGLAQALRERVPDIDYVDLRFDDRIYVRPVGSGPGRRMVALNNADRTAAVAQTSVSRR
jgi:cell division protein FtsQ